MDHWGLRKPFVFGHDFGGGAVLRTHLLEGRKFEKIVLVDPVAVSPWGSPFFRPVRKHEAAFVGVPDRIHDAIVRAYVETAAFKPLDETVLDMILRPWSGPEGKAAFYRQIAQADQRFTDEVQPMYPRISAPVLILWGREDTWIPLERGEALRNMIPGSLFCAVSDVGRLVIEEQPEGLVEIMCSFLLDEEIAF